MRARQILAIIHDPGACGMLLPVLTRLNNENQKNFHLKAGRLVADRLNLAGILFDKMEEEAGPNEISNWFESYKPEVVLTGTSWGSTIEQQVRNKARKLQIKSVVAVDYWANYKERWNGADYPLKTLSDEICVVDDFMKAEIIQADFPEKQIEVTGHPFLETLSASGVKKKLDIHSLRKILFLSEPLRDETLVKICDEALVSVADVLNTFGEKSKARLTVHFKVHPKEKRKLPEVWRNTSRWPHLAIELVSDLSFPQGFKDFDLVVGYQSMGLLEAALSGIPTISKPLVSVSSGLAQAFKKANILNLNSENLTQWINQTDSQVKPLYTGATEFLLRKVLE